MVAKLLRRGRLNFTPQTLAIRVLCGSLLVVAVAIVGTRSQGFEQGYTIDPDGAAQGPSDAAAMRLREGTTLVEQLGSFQMTGDRATFVTADGKYRFVGLENLNLDRVVRTLAEDAENTQWAVTGTITEFRGSNYLLIQRAVRKLQPVAAAAAAGLSVGAEQPE